MYLQSEGEVVVASGDIAYFKAWLLAKVVHDSFQSTTWMADGR